MKRATASVDLSALTVLEVTRSPSTIAHSSSVHPAADGTGQLLDVWDAYTVAAGVVHSEEFHERTFVFEVHIPSNLDFEERYERQVRLRDQSARDGFF